MVGSMTLPSCRKALQLYYRHRQCRLQSAISYEGRDKDLGMDTFTPEAHTSQMNAEDMPGKALNHLREAVRTLDTAS
jgi:hypothetical protein